MSVFEAGVGGERGLEMVWRGKDRKGYIATHWTENSRTTVVT
jgi:hypothetical protein